VRARAHDVNRAANTFNRLPPVGAYPGLLPSPDFLLRYPKFDARRDNDVDSSSSADILRARPLMNTVPARNRFAFDETDSTAASGVPKMGARRAGGSVHRTSTVKAGALETAPDFSADAIKRDTRPALSDMHSPVYRQRLLDALQLCLLFIPLQQRCWLNTTVEFMRGAADNRTLHLHPVLSNRYVVSMGHTHALSLSVFAVTRPPRPDLCCARAARSSCRCSPDDHTHRSLEATIHSARCTVP
jgi:hypothetical protein